MEFICPACGLRHIRQGRIVDEYIRCGCGLDLYVFYNEGMTFTVPAKEMMSESLKQAFQRLVIGTGRCPGAKVEPVTVSYMDILRRIEPLTLTEIALRKLQEETYGETLMHCWDAEEILDILHEPEKDALVKRTKDGVMVREQKTRKPRRPRPDYLRLLEDNMAALANQSLRFAEEPLKQWQIDIMEEDAARTGLLFGKTS